MHYKDQVRPGYLMDSPKLPAIRVSWNQAMAFCQWVSALTGKSVTLPTEAQWEWACRAGTDTPMYYGGLDSDFSRYANLADASISRLAVSGVDPQPISNPDRFWDFVPKEARFNDGNLHLAECGHYQPNAWGLQDMIGNVAEWTRDNYRAYPYEAGNRPAPAEGQGEGRKAVRGGSWAERPKESRASTRLDYPAWQRVYNVGFRVVVLDRPVGTRGRHPDDQEPHFHAPDLRPHVCAREPYKSLRIGRCAPNTEANPRTHETQSQRPHRLPRRGDRGGGPHRGRLLAGGDKNAKPQNPVNLPKYQNSDFYQDGKFQADKAKQAYFGLMEAHGYPVPDFLRTNMWATDFGLGELVNVGMGGIFWINDEKHGYFAHEIYLLPGQMIVEHGHDGPRRGRPRWRPGISGMGVSGPSARRASRCRRMSGCRRARRSTSRCGRARCCPGKSGP